MSVKVTIIKTLLSDFGRPQKFYIQVYFQSFPGVTIIVII